METILFEIEKILNNLQIFTNSKILLEKSYFNLQQVLTKVRNELKRSKNYLQPFKTTKNNQYKNKIDSSKVSVLDFECRLGLGSGQEMT